jgi:hypothetical protein
MSSKFNDRIITIPNPGGNALAFSPYLPNVSYTTIIGSNLSTGDNDLYTVPSGKRLYVYQSVSLYNASAGNIAVINEYKRSGTYYLLSNTGTSIGSGNGSIFTMAPIILEAADILSINTATNNGLNAFYTGQLFDSSSQLKTASVLSLSNGDNTIYTCPAGKSAIIVNSSYYNNSGGAIVTYLNFVPSGSSPGTGNRFATSFSVSDKNFRNFNLPYTLSAGDFVSINTASGNAGQQAWVNVIEI